MLKLLTLLVAAALSMAATAAEVERVRGDATLLRGLASLPLVQGSELLNGDEIRVGPVGEVLIRIDRKIAFLLRGGASMMVSDVSKETGFALRLLMGALRYVSGARDNPHNFRVITPHASTGVRGTDFEILVLIEPIPSGLSSGTYVTVREGAVDVTDAITGTTASVTQEQSVYALAPGRDPNPSVAIAPRPRALARPPVLSSGVGARSRISDGLWRIDPPPTLRGEFDDVLDALR